MLARLQQWTTLALLALAVTCAVLLAIGGLVLWAVAVFVLFAAGHAIVLGLEFLWLAGANRADPAPAATAAELFGAWWGEVLAATQVFFWQQPFRSRAVPDCLAPCRPGAVGIVFVHGFVCNRGLWNPWLKRLRRLGVAFVAVDLEPVFGSIDEYPAIIERAVRRVELATAARPLIVAHSMGGLAVRAWLDAWQAEARVRHVVTIGTPHRGTLLAAFARSPNALQMRPGSRWQRALAGREPGSRYARFTCFYGHCDNVVFPASNATLPGADNRHVRGVAHVRMARDEAVFQEVLRRAGISSAPRDPS
jgi:triacylglycerol esterase/lipase EstA (alpha/beta hydrolase family)